MDRIARSRELHADGCFVMPRRWDHRSGRRLEAMGFPTLATSSFGHAECFGSWNESYQAA